MKKINKLLLISLLGVLLTSCAHSVHQYGVSDYSAKIKSNTKKIKVESEQFVILFFSQDTNYVNEAYVKLQKKCRGEISGINTRYSTSLGFFSWYNKIHIEAYCL